VDIFVTNNATVQDDTGYTALRYHPTYAHSPFSPQVFILTLPGVARAGCILVLLPHSLSQLGELLYEGKGGSKREEVS
jgi:hypothetical protein